VKVRFLSTFNTAPSTSNHDWDNIGDVTVSSDFILNSSSSAPYSTTCHTPPGPCILTLLVVSFLFLEFIIYLPSFPIRGVCLMDGLLPSFLTSMDAHGRSVRPSSTYHPRFTDSMDSEADRGIDMESTVILSRFPL
jgi:hypothetical protein